MNEGQKDKFEKHQNENQTQRDLEDGLDKDGHTDLRSLGANNVEEAAKDMGDC